MDQRRQAHSLEDYHREASKAYAAHVAKVQADALGKELARKSDRRIDCGQQPIDDSPLFGGDRQGSLF